MADATTLHALIQTGADDATALSSPGGVPLTFKALRALAERTIADLNGQGVGRGDRVAIVLPNGPEMATAFIAVAAGCTSAPLNPSYKADEFEFYLNDLHAKLLIVAEGSDSAAVAVAEKLGVAVARLTPQPDQGAGSFSLSFAGEGSGEAAEGGPAKPEDIALVLHTSGTTSRPKIVPLKQSNVCASARNIRTALAFTPDDRGLNIMPLFHIHGLIAGILAPLSAGGQVSCTPGFNALKFFGWMGEVKPTWYTGVPTMHQAILGRAARNREVIEATPLRFIRSSSSSLPPQVMNELEAAFGAPVIEAYGMTEAAHQMASNPLPPKPHHAGSVGLAAGPEIAVVDLAGEPLPAGETGEIVIRGDNVMTGYENNEKANAEAFTRQGWFRTGDQGVLTPEGYLSITGRLKEIINRGGEKISPREIDEILMDHPAVAQCVTFATPHDKLGEDVAAAIVLREGASAGEKEIRGFASERLAPFKVPAKIVILDEIPKGATGKLQRIGLAEKLGLV
ncbi:acyl--CoA ligase [Methylobacterium haplocladii]|uniref:AMP-dependent synthetase n=1 Tax=Methylobacterium haplocladii TaxID=1176176 RepID=A0A512ILI5_9HYPH|nr:acyl--CoA ligase [Methylobacterium haplocladii]GEO98554.1 AMP-dependent synthetase [Methylobacterium haplocladii]GJD85165.1 putative sulfoacetate--CoA ligase [Methylobacterium haplocladii]GLS59900.1 AMP-dependent synthetase [Methylobacterium haplocladii]